MRPPRLRLTVGFLMILVALGGFTLSAWRVSRWSIQCRQNAIENERWEHEYQRTSQRLRREAGNYATALDSHELPEPKQKRLRYLVRQRTRATQSTAELSAFHRRMRQKWEYAATHPWVDVEPDPWPPK